MLRFNKNRLASAFDRFYLEAGTSSAYLKFCHEVHGQDIFQFNLMDKDQYSILGRFAGIIPGSKILDLGCGPGRLTNYLFGDLDASIYGIDISIKAIEMAKLSNKNVQFIVGDIERPPFKREKFTHIFALDSLYNLPNVPKLILKWKKNLTSDGVFLIFHNNIKGKSLGRDLSKVGLEFREVNLTDNLGKIIERSKNTLEQLKKSFIKEGNEWLYKTKKLEILKLSERTESRYLYIIKGS